MSSDPNETEPLLIQQDSNEIHLAEYRTLNSSPSNSTLPTTSARANRLSRRRVTRNDESSINNNNNNDNTDVEETRINLKYGIQQIIQILIPVTICLVFVITTVTVITSYQKTNAGTLLYTPFDENSQSNSTKLWMSVANASIFIAFVVIMTVVLVVLYKYKFYRFIHGWLAFSSLSLLFFFNYMYIRLVFELSELLMEFNLVVDIITIVFFLWNFGVVGMAVIHWKGPLVLQQFYLIFVCVQISLRFIKYLPEWTTWVVLAFLSIWDLIAVLCPFGPLRILVETAHQRNDQLFPAMVYSSTLIYTIIANINNSPNENSEIESSNNSDPVENTNNIVQTNESNNDNQSDLLRSVESESSDINGEELKEEEEQNGFKLGLGDFIFYSILCGKASILGDWNTVIACFVAIIMGLLFTTLLLAIYHKPLPALPISLLFGLIFYFSTNLVVRPFYDDLTYNQYFI